MTDQYTEAVHLTHREMMTILRRLDSEKDKELCEKFQWLMDDPDWIYRPPNSFGRGVHWKRR